MIDHQMHLQALHQHRSSSGNAVQRVSSSGMYPMPFGTEQQEYHDHMATATSWGDFSYLGASTGNPSFPRTASMEFLTSLEELRSFPSTHSIENFQQMLGVGPSSGSGLLNGSSSGNFPWVNSNPNMAFSDWPSMQSLGGSSPNIVKQEHSEGFDPSHYLHSNSIPSSSGAHGNNFNNPNKRGGYPGLASQPLTKKSVNIQQGGIASSLSYPPQNLGVDHFSMVHGSGPVQGQGQGHDFSRVSGSATGSGATGPHSRISSNQGHHSPLSADSKSQSQISGERAQISRAQFPPEGPELMLSSIGVANEIVGVGSETASVLGSHIGAGLIRIISIPQPCIHSFQFC